MIYDITPPIDSRLPVWPGDTAFSARLAWSIAAGASVNVSAITTTPHLGAHADAPFHTDDRGRPIDAMPIHPYLGPCRVIEISGTPDLLTPTHIQGIDCAAAPRLLFKTRSVRDRTRFPERCCAFSPALVEAAAAAGAVLLGIDTPSVDPLDSKTLPAHAALWKHGLANLENLLLDEVPAGTYELIALPLRLAGLDASPVRAILREFQR